MPKGEASPIKMPKAKTELVSNTLNTLETLRILEPVIKEDSETCRERIQMLFDFCRDTGRIPTVELLCLAVGRSRQTLLDWSSDERCENGKIITMAKATINALLTEMAINGTVNPVYVMFSQKCNFHYVEPKQAVQVEVKPQYNVAPMNREQLLEEIGSYVVSEELSDLPPLPQIDVESEEQE